MICSLPTTVINTFLLLTPIYKEATVDPALYRFGQIAETTKNTKSNLYRKS